MKTRLQRITDLLTYLRDFTVPGLPSPILGVDNAQTTSALTSKSGPQLVAAYPEVAHKGNSDTYVETLQTAFFVLDKALGAARTAEAEFDQYLRLATLADAVLTRIERDTTSPFVSPIGSLTLLTATVTPEASLFGGWVGYTIELSLQ